MAEIPLLAFMGSSRRLGVRLADCVVDLGLSETALAYLVRIGLVLAAWGVVALVAVPDSGSNERPAAKSEPKATVEPTTTKATVTSPTTTADVTTESNPAPETTTESKPAPTAATATTPPSATAACARAGQTVDSYNTLVPGASRKEHRILLHKLQRDCPQEAVKRGLAAEFLPRCKRLDQENCTMYRES